MNLKSYTKSMVILLLSFTVLVAVDEQETYEDKVERASQLMKSQSKSAYKLLEEAVMEFPLRGEAYIERGIYFFKYAESPFLAGINFKRGVGLLTELKDRKTQANRIMKITSNPNSSKEGGYIEEGIKYLDEKLPRKAIKSFIEAIKLNEYNPKTYYNLGYALVEIGKLDKAVYFLDKGLLLCPMHKPILEELVYVYTELGMMEQAIDSVNELMKYFGKNPQLDYELALSYMKQKDLTKAETILTDLMETNPEFLRSAFLLSELYIAQGQCHRAITLLQYFRSEITKEN